MSKTDLVKAKLAKNPDPDPETIQKWTKEIGCSKALVYKWRARVPEAQRMAAKPAEPVLKVEEEEEEIIEEPEPAEESEFEVPSEFAEEKLEVPTEEAEEEEEIAISEEAKEVEEQRILKDISKRAVKRLFGIAIEEGLGLGKECGLTDQESEDTEFLIMLLVAKYLMIEVKENVLEVTGVLHFGSVGAKLLVAWLKKRKAEKKKEEEKPVKTPEPAKPVEEKPIEVPLATEEEAHIDTEEEREKRVKSYEKDYKNRVLRG